MAKSSGGEGACNSWKMVALEVEELAEGGRAEGLRGGQSVVSQSEPK